MRALLLSLLVLATVLAGCAGKSGGGDEEESGDFSDLGLENSGTTGVIRGVVIDEAIRPVAGATVRLLLAEPQETVTDDEGRFGFSNVEPGTWEVAVELLNYRAATVQVAVVAGISAPPVTKVQLERLFIQDPYTEQVLTRAFLNCGFVVLGVSSTCINDYTRVLPDSVCPGGCVPQVANNLGLDKREYVTPVPSGWQSMIFEMDWEPSASGTSDRMGITISHSQRTATHFYASGGSPAPLRLQMLVGVDGPNSQQAPDPIPPEGIPNMQVLTNVAAGQPALAVALQQDYEIVQTNFVWGLPPEGWSFVAGDELPF